MKPARDTEDAATTASLLGELDQVLDQSQVLRELYNAYQRLHGIESITGDTHQTRLLRAEIELLENRLEIARNRSINRA